MKTKKKIFSIIILIFISKTVFAQSDEYKLTNINEEYIGTYIPVDLELRLYQSKKFYKSLYASRKYGKTKPHDVLYLQKNICYSDLGFHDGYAIKNKEFINYKFIADNDVIFCIDNNGYLYRKISNSEYGYEDYAEYVMKIILSNYQNSSEIKINGYFLNINGKEYPITLDGNFFDTENAAIWLFSDKHYVLEKNGIDGGLFSGKGYEDHMGNTKDVLISRFQGMFELKENDLPDYSTVTKKTLRLFRNLIFARNGYVFKSKDLQDYFNSCTWYNPKHQFNENDMRKDEKDFISLMQIYESK